MRNASDADYFPYGWPGGLVCYFVIVGTVPQQLKYRDSMRHALRSGATIYATWPGQYRSDLFVIDAPERLAAEIGFDLAHNLEG